MAQFAPITIFSFLPRPPPQRAMTIRNRRTEGSDITGMASESDAAMAAGATWAVRRLFWCCRGHRWGWGISRLLCRWYRGYRCHSCLPPPPLLPSPLPPFFVAVLAVRVGIYTASNNPVLPAVNNGPFYLIVPPQQSLQECIAIAAVNGTCLGRSISLRYDVIRRYGEPSHPVHDKGYMPCTTKVGIGID